jgi:hypothetical protein
MASTPTRNRLSNGTSSSSVTMAASDDDAMEEASVFTLSSPPRSASKSSAATALFEEEHKQETTPKSSRRLFDDDADEHGSLFRDSKAPALTPFNTRTTQRRLTRPVQREDSIDCEDLSGRKRSSEERRESHESDTSMCTSPHASPNSYMTMDGRFVHSRNPFSSPMVTDDDHHHQNQHLMAGAPAFPLSLAASHSSEQEAPDPKSCFVSATPASPFRPSAVGMLPPRHAREKRATYRQRYQHGSPEDEDTNGPGTFLDARFSFTGSPIPEHSRSSPLSMSGGPPALAEGSLFKVRRLHKDDDVVSASGQHFYINQPSQRRRNNYLSVDTAPSDLSCGSFSDASSGAWRPEEEDTERISPTDVAAFPPPTPARAPSRYHRKKSPPVPPTPVAQRRHEKLVQRRTPHPGSILRRHRPESDDEVTKIRSRFYDDFDIIQELGKGAFGTVYQVLSRLDGVSDIT